MQNEQITKLKTEQKTISIKLPRAKLPSIQATVLVLLIAVGALQTVQLYGLSTRVGSGEVRAATSPTTSSGSTNSTTSSLPTMVGGC